MQDTPCPADPAQIESLTLGIGEGLQLIGEVAGCHAGPIADLRAAAQELVDEHAAEPQP